MIYSFTYSIPREFLFDKVFLSISWPFFIFILECYHSWKGASRYVMMKLLCEICNLINILLRKLSSSIELLNSIRNFWIKLWRFNVLIWANRSFIMDILLWIEELKVFWIILFFIFVLSKFDILPIRIFNDDILKWAFVQ